MENYQIIVKRGIWLYDHLVEKPIIIFKQNWDYYYEEGYSEEPPSLNEDGEAYYICYSEDRWGNNYLSPQSHTCYSITEAIQLASETITSPIKWEI